QSGRQECRRGVQADLGQERPRLLSRLAGPRLLRCAEPEGYGPVPGHVDPGAVRRSDQEGLRRRAGEPVAPGFTAAALLEGSAAIRQRRGIWRQPTAPSPYIGEATISISSPVRSASC